MRNLPLVERHRAVMPKWMALYYDEPISLARGEGRTVWDGDGNEYLDFFGGILTTMTAYNPPEVVEALRDQAGRMLHSSTLYLIESQVELAEKIAALSGISDARVFFTNSGSEANDAALMMATAYRASNHILAMRHSYHGRSFSTVPVTGMASWSPSSLSPFNVSYVHGSYRYRSPFRTLDDAAYIKACTEDLENILQVATSGNVACLIAEPILGVGGFATPPDGLFGEFRKVLDRYGILHVSDEVQTGWGRTGEHFWGYQAHGMTPDLITFAKGLGNGLAIGGVVGRAEIIDCFKASSISTFGGNPLATRGALANLAILERDNLPANARVRGAELFAGLRRLQARHPRIGDVRGKGLMVGLELNEADGWTPSRAAAKAILEETKKRGLLVGMGGFHGNVIRLAPPLSVTQAECARGLAILEDCFSAVFDSRR
ncbi:MAG TPA: aspartate aminotransferase family protein [Parvularcula sp.]|nr:aspartate aminotransferase family protein [Parvularcula sp.]